MRCLADARDAQFLVIGARGRHGFNHQFLGSVALAMLHYSPCPVAIVKSS